jgi:hypothetical protein
MEDNVIIVCEGFDLMIQYTYLFYDPSDRGSDKSEGSKLAFNNRAMKVRNE